MMIATPSLGEYKQTILDLLPDQGCWSEEVNHHKYSIVYHSGIKNGKADTLTWHCDLSEGGKLCRHPL